jgi:hypothetical protein
LGLGAQLVAHAEVEEVEKEASAVAAGGGNNSNNILPAGRARQSSLSQVANRGHAGDTDGSSAAGSIPTRNTNTKDVGHTLADYLVPAVRNSLSQETHNQGVELRVEEEQRRPTPAAWTVLQFADRAAPERRLRKHSIDATVDRSAPMSDLLSMKQPEASEEIAAISRPSEPDINPSISQARAPFPRSTDPLDERVVHQAKLLSKVHHQNVILKLQRSTQVRGQKLRLLALTPILRSRVRKSIDRGRIGDGQGGEDFCTAQELSRLLESVDVFVSTEEAKYIVTEALTTESAHAHELLQPLSSVAEPSVKLGNAILFLANLIS